SVIPIHVPPLRERREDIEPLARHFLRKYSLQIGKPLRDFDAEALSALRHYAWPGNVRELENAIERAVAVSGDRDGLIRVENLPESVTGMSALGEKAVRIPEEGVDFEKLISQTEKQYLAAALREAGGVRTRAAELLRMSYRSFRHYAKKYGI
ncbi:MAG: sigma-54-dependent Fis family transcriptional regulator, partial [Acidobacteriia bacterium]|nr:sigma-54-dependent Fis family transcriptional regulator [Terriglobia bacterium]